MLFLRVVFATYLENGQRGRKTPVRNPEKTCKGQPFMCHAQMSAGQSLPGIHVDEQEVGQT
ncbi:hypothetical protein GCM10020220_051480 [Nonomuraea rubra]